MAGFLPARPGTVAWARVSGDGVFAVGYMQAAKVCFAPQWRTDFAAVNHRMTGIPEQIPSPGTFARAIA